MDELELRAAEPTGIHADDVGLDFPARLSPSVGTAFLDDEAILLDPATGDSHLLDGPATLIVQCFDGRSPLGDIALDIAEILRLDRAVVEEDVLGLVRTLGARGLVDGVERTSHAGHDHGESGGLPVGSDLSGWEGWAGVAARPMLLVNWGTSCGYCTRIADDLAGLVPALEAVGIGLLLVTTGTPEQLREQLVDVDMPTLHVEELPDFFEGIGTPVAYAVDAARLTTSGLALGAVAVPELAETLTDRPQNGSTS